MYGWIPCSEKLPDETKDYLTTRTSFLEKDKTVIDIEIYSTEYGWLCGDVDILAWMPLPEPYEGEKS